MKKSLVFLVFLANITLCFANNYVIVNKRLECYYDLNPEYHYDTLARVVYYPDRYTEIESIHGSEYGVVVNFSTSESDYYSLKPGELRLEFEPTMYGIPLFKMPDQKEPSEVKKGRFSVALVEGCYKGRVQVLFLGDGPNRELLSGVNMDREEVLSTGERFWMETKYIEKAKREPTYQFVFNTAFTIHQDSRDSTLFYDFEGKHVKMSVFPLTVEGNAGTTVSLVGMYKGRIAFLYNGELMTVEPGRLFFYAEPGYILYKEPLFDSPFLYNKEVLEPLEVLSVLGEWIYTRIPYGEGYVYGWIYYNERQGNPFC